MSSTNRIQEIDSDLVARITTGHRVTIPTKVYKSLELKEGDFVYFFRKNDNKVEISPIKMTIKP